MHGSLVKMFDVKKSEGDVALPADIGRVSTAPYPAHRSAQARQRPGPWDFVTRPYGVGEAHQPPVYKGESMAQVLKINPYHDGDGKFTTKDKSKIFSGKKLPTGQAKELTGAEADTVIAAAKFTKDKVKSEMDKHLKITKETTDQMFKLSPGSKEYEKALASYTKSNNALNMLRKASKDLQDGAGEERIANWAREYAKQFEN